MYHFYDVVINEKTGVPLSNVIIRIYDDAGVIVPLFADETGSTPIEAVSGLANAAVTDGEGNYDFYIADGTYDIRFFVGDAVLKVLANILMGFPNVDGKAQAAALGVAGSANNLGTFTTILVDDDTNVKQALESIGSNLASSAGSRGSEAIGFPDPIAPAYLKTVSDIISGLPVSVMRFMPNRLVILDILARTNTDNLAPYFADALASGVRELVCPPGLYNTDSPIAMSTANQKLVGAGWNTSQINVRSTSASAITLANGVAGYGVKGFMVTRTGVAAVNADGIRCLGTTDNSVIEDVWLEGHSVGLTVGTCDTGHIRRIRSTKNLQSGVFQTNSASYGPSQWDADDVLVDRNTVDGWRIVSNTGPAGLIMGQMRNLRSFANTGWGLNLLGNATTGIYDLRLSDAFMGSDGLGSINLDTYGGKHRISGFFERNGRDATGPSVSTPASAIGVGINITAANSDVNIYGSMIDENAYDGISHSGAILTVTGCHIYNNGFAAVAGRRNGILSNSGRLIASGNAIKNISGSSQLYGIATGHDDVILSGNDLVGNATGATTLGSTVDAVLMGNAGTPFHRIPAGASLTVGDPTGATGTNSINVATDIKKNGTAYVNP